MPRSYDGDDRDRRRDRRRGGNTYEEKEEIYARRGGGSKQNARALVRRSDDSDSGETEDIRRDFPPPGRDYVKRRSTRKEYDRGSRRRAKSTGYSSSDSEDYYRRKKRSGGGAGDRRRDRRYSDSQSDSRSPPRGKPGDRRKSIVEQALAAAGLGGAASALLQGKDPREALKDPHGGRDRRDDRARSRDRRGNGRYSDSSRSRSRSRSGSRSLDTRKKMMQAGKAAALAGATEAWRTRKEPGGVPGNLKRIATAAIGAAGVDSALDRDPNKAGSRHVLESALGGIMGNRIIHGKRESKSRSRSRDRGGRGGSRSRSRGGGGGGGMGLGALASSAGLATLATKAYKNYRNRSRGGGSGSDSGSDRGRGGGSDRGRGIPGGGGSDRGRGDAKGGVVNQFRGRSKSLSRMVNAGLAKLNLDDPAKTRDANGIPRPRGGALGTKGSSPSSSDTDSYSSDKEIKKHRKMRTKELMIAGLASVATIHAGHQVYSSIKQRQNRRVAVADGEMTPQEATKLRNRAHVKQAASIGIAALGIKSMIGEFKEMQEVREEVHEHQRRLDEKRQHRRQKMMQAGAASDPNLGGRYLDGAPQYNQGGNPYATTNVPPPPMGQARR